ncbi:MAG: hypothetical protein AABY36_07115, partial [Campylobacterota bacterium]
SDIGNHLTHDNDLVLFGHSLGVTDSSYFKDYILRLTFNLRRLKLMFYHYGDTGYDEIMNVIDEYTHNNLTNFRNYNDFILIDSSVEEKAD